MAGVGGTRFVGRQHGDLGRGRRLAVGVAAAVGLLAGSAAGLGAAEKPPREVTYSDILRDPDNFDLNLSFARAEIRRGEFQSASTVLHRLILLRPGSLAARVLYAVVLYRLDSFNEARRQLDLLLAHPQLPKQLRKELEIYRGEIERRLRRTNAQLMVSSGLAVDTNPSRLPDSNSFGGLNLSTSERRKADIALVNYMRVSVEHDLNMPQRQTLFGSVSTYHMEYKDTPRSSHLILTGEAGARLNFGPWRVTPKLTGRWMFLSHEQFMRSLEARLTVGRDLDRQTRLSGYVAAGPRLFDDLAESPDQRQRTGAEYRGGLRLRRNLDHTMAVTLEAEFIRDSAAADYYSLSGYRLSAGHRWRFRNGMFLLSRFVWRLDQYDGRNPADGVGGARRDSSFNVGTLFGLPLLTIDRSLPSFFNRTALTLNVDYWTTDSNIGRYTNDNWRIVIGLTKRFDL